MTHRPRKITGRPLRILLCTLLPITLVVLAVLLFGLLVAGAPRAGVTRFLLITLYGGFLVMGIPSLISALLMEFLINPNLAHNDTAIVMGGLLGVLNGLYLVFLLDPGTGPMAIWLPVGMVVGLLMGALSRWHFQKNVAYLNAGDGA